MLLKTHIGFSVNQKDFSDIVPMYNYVKCYLRLITALKYLFCYLSQWWLVNLQDKAKEKGLSPA